MQKNINYVYVSWNEPRSHQKWRLRIVNWKTFNIKGKIKGRDGKISAFIPRWFKRKDRCGIHGTTSIPWKHWNKSFREVFSCYLPLYNVHTGLKGVAASVHHGKGSWPKLQLLTTPEQSLPSPARLHSGADASLETESWQVPHSWTHRDTGQRLQAHASSQLGRKQG